MSWSRLIEWIPMTPDETGLDQKFPPEEAGDDYPYGEPGCVDSPMDPTGQFANTHAGPPTPHDVEHSSWDDAVKEAGGLGITFVKSSPGGMTGVTPGGAKFGGDPFDHEIDDDELDRFGEGSGDPYDQSYNDEELDQFLGDMARERELQDVPSSPFPSDIVVFQGDGYTSGASQAYRNHRDLYGIADAVDGDLPKRSVWTYLESFVENLFKEKLRK